MNNNKMVKQFQISTIREILSTQLGSKKAQAANLENIQEFLVLIYDSTFDQRTRSMIEFFGQQVLEYWSLDVLEDVATQDMEVIDFTYQGLTKILKNIKEN